MMKQRNLKDLLEPGFAEGYDEFKEMVKYAEGDNNLPVRDKASIRLYELISLAVISGLNEIEAKYEMPPEETVPLMWHAAAMAIATANGTAFTKPNGKIRKMCFEDMERSYKSFLKITKDSC